MDYRDAHYIWPGIYKAIHEILGDSHAILAFGDQRRGGKVNASTFNAVQMGETGPTSRVWTPSEELSAFDTPFDLTDPANWRGVVPVLTLNGTDEEADTPDDGFYSRDDGNSEAFTIGLWVIATAGEAQQTLLAKWNATTGSQAREWHLYLDANEKLVLELFDESVDKSTVRQSDAAVATDRLIFVVATYDGTGGATAGNGITLYVDGAAVASTATNDASYVAMEDLAGVVSLAYETGTADPESFFGGSMMGGPLGPFFAAKELTATEVRDLYEIGAGALGL